MATMSDTRRATLLTVQVVLNGELRQQGRDLADLLHELEALYGTPTVPYLAYEYWTPDNHAHTVLTMHLRVPDEPDDDCNTLLELLGLHAVEVQTLAHKHQTRKGEHDVCVLEDRIGTIAASGSSRRELDA